MILWTKKVVQKWSKKWSIEGVFSMASKNVQNGPKKWSIGPVLDQLEIAKNASTTRVLGLFGPVTHFFCLFSVRKNFLYNNIEKKSGLLVYSEKMRYFYK